MRCSQSEERLSNLVFVSMNRPFEEDEARAWYWHFLSLSDRWICRKETKNWIDLQINFDNWLFVDFLIFCHDQ